LCAGASLSFALDLKPETAEAFDRYIAGTEAKLQARRAIISCGLMTRQIFDKVYLQAQS
jgi:hypothetical protein